MINLSQFEVSKTTQVLVRGRPSPGTRPVPAFEKHCPRATKLLRCCKNRLAREPCTYNSKLQKMVQMQNLKSRFEYLMCVKRIK